MHIFIVRNFDLILLGTSYLTIWYQKKNCQLTHYTFENNNIAKVQTNASMNLDVSMLDPLCCKSCLFAHCASSYLIVSKWYNWLAFVIIH